MQQDTFVKERTALAVQPEQGEDTIDLLELFMGLLAHWTLIAATAVVGAVLMALYTFFLVTPMYKATATIYVVSRNDSVLNFSDLQVGSELTSEAAEGEGATVTFTIAKEQPRAEPGEDTSGGSARP